MGFANRITNSQKSYITDLLRKRGYDTRTITYQYRRLGVPDSKQGESVDSWLDGMTREDASAVIDELREDV
jgi:hypothetical protein